MDVPLVIFVFFCILGTALCGDYCYDDGDSFYCTYGCCGNYYDEYCCGAYTWVIAVAVVGSIFVVSGIVFIICFFKKKKLKPGRVVTDIPQPQQVQTNQHLPPSFQPTTAGYKHTTTGYQPNAPGYQPAPPVYQPAQPAPVGFQPYGQPQPSGFQQQGQVYPPPPPVNYGADPAYPPDSRPRW